jgi:hypothetical protein
VKCRRDRERQSVRRLFIVLQSAGWSNAPLKESHMDTTTLLIIIIVLLVLGGGWYGRGRWF